MSRFNLKGWDVLEWIKGNKTTIEEGVKIIVPGFLASLALPAFGAWHIVATAVGKLILDVVHYWVSK